MVMKTVNPYFFIELLEPLVGMADIDEEVETYRNINPDSEEEIKKIIIDVLKPHFDSLSEVKKEQCKITLSYYLTTSTIDFERIFASYLLPFDPPSTPQLFFMWLWEVLFEGEEYIMENPDQCVEKNDVYEPLRC
jgi:hypothetical protein